MRRYKGMVLAAGSGSRLRPLTDITPKPLVPFYGVPPLYLAISKLKSIGIEEIAINGSHLVEIVENALQDFPLDVGIYLSKEESILGTGGAYPPIMNWLGDHDLIVLNGDVIQTTDLHEMKLKHESSGWIASTAVKPGSHPGEKAVWIDESCRVWDIGKLPPNEEKRSFLGTGWLGAQILTQEFLRSLPKNGSFCIIDQYLAGISAGRKIGAYVSDPIWFDLGTPQRFFQAHRAVLENPESMVRDLGLDDWWNILGRDFRFGNPETRNRNLAYESNCVIEEMSDLGQDVVVMGPNRIKRGMKMESSILLPDSFLPSEGGRKKIFWRGSPVEIR